MIPTRVPLRPLLAAALALGLAACGDDSAADTDGGPNPDGGDVVDGGLPDGVSTGDCGLYYCNGTLCACNDGMDNDLDGYIDLMDPACAEPWDNAETNNFTPGSTQCTDGNDNDTDGMIDSADPECTGALDDDE